MSSTASQMMRFHASAPLGLNHLVALGVLLEGGQEAGDLLLADLHRPCDTAGLRLAGGDEVRATGDETDRGTAQRLASGVGDEVHAEVDVASQVFLGGGVHDHGHGGVAGELDAARQRDHPLLRRMVRLHEQQRGDVRALEGMRDLVVAPAVRRSGHHRPAAAEADHLLERHAEVHPVPGLDHHTVRPPSGVGQRGHGARIVAGDAGGDRDHHAGGGAGGDTRRFGTATLRDQLPGARA